MKTLLLAVVVCLFGQAACDKGSKPTAPAANAPVIKVTASGRDPKQTLRFTAKPGLSKVMTFTMDMVMTVDSDGSPRTQRVPTIEMTMDLTVTGVAANGDIRYEFKLREPDVSRAGDPTTSAAVKQVLTDMTGLSGSAVVTNRGFTKQVDVRLPSGANAQAAQFVDTLKQSLGYMSAPLPEEPVGVGAKWETTIKLDQSGLALEQVALNELTALDGTTITFDVATKQTAAPQKIIKDGTTVDLMTYAASGEGRTTIDLTQLVPTRGHVATKSDMQMVAGGRELRMALDLKVGLLSQ